MQHYLLCSYKTDHLFPRVYKLYKIIEILTEDEMVVEKPVKVIKTVAVYPKKSKRFFDIQLKGVCEAYLPSKKSNYVICSHFSDEYYEFENDTQARLWFELEMLSRDDD